MMLTKRAKERSTFAISVAFKNESGQTVSPDTVVWSLLDERGQIINNRDQVTLTAGHVVLSGDDLEVPTPRRTVVRRLLVEGTYTSTKGIGLPVREIASFYLDNLRAVQ